VRKLIAFDDDTFDKLKQLARARPAWSSGRDGAARVQYSRSGARHAGTACRFRLGVHPRLIGLTGSLAEGRKTAIASGRSLPKTALPRATIRSTTSDPSIWSAKMGGMSERPLIRDEARSA
jgi:hypothetical protein